MKKGILFGFALLFACLAASAQVSNPSIVPVTVSPAGNACTANLPLKLLVPAGTLFTCQNGVYAAATGGTGGSAVNTQLVQELVNAKTTPVNIVVAGDSFTICDFVNCTYGPVTPASRWAEQLRIALQAQYGEGGTGLVPVVSSFPSGSLAQINSHAWSCTGSIAFNATFGPSQGANGSNVTMSAGSTCTFHDDRNLAWNTLEVYCGEASSNGELDVTIDGGASTTVCKPASPVSGALALVVQIPTTLSTSHVVVMSAPGFGFPFGAQGINSAGGVSVSNVGVSGALASSYGSTIQMAYTDLIPGGQQAFIYEDQTNDVANSIATGTFSASIQTTITHELALTPVPQIILAIPPVDVVSGTHSFTAYTAAQVALCTSNALQCMNMAANFGPYSAGSGLWDLSGVAWPTGTAGVHPNNAGNTYEYQLTSSALLNRFIDVAQ